MVSKMNSVLVAGLVLVMFSAVFAYPEEYYSQYFRTYPPPRPDCRSGLCPLPKRLVPDAPKPPYYGHAGHAGRSHEEYGEPSLCGNLCTADNNCPEGQKCCPTTCGYACQAIVHLSD